MVAIAEAPVRPVDVRQAGYPLLVRALANLCLYLVPESGGARPYALTPELGVYRLPHAAPFDRPEAASDRIGA